MFVFINILVLRSPSFQVRDGAGYCVFTENVAVICLILANAVFAVCVCCRPRFCSFVVLRSHGDKSVSAQ